jgi:restriction endonuclease S subunit
MSTKNSVDSVSISLITEMTILLPSLFEQQRIAECLIPLGDLIAGEIQ